MKTISLITVGRDDNFANDFIDRLHKSISTNIKFLDKNGISFEYIVVDWFPINNQLLHKNDVLLPLFEDKRIKHVVVDNSIAKTETLNPLIFYEYFAKNVGIRTAKNDYVFIINSDIIIPQQMWGLIAEVLNEDDINTQNFFRPAVRVNIEVINENQIRTCDSTTLKNTGCDDDVICGGYSGDFLFISRKTLIESGKGYNEEDPGHRQQNRWQTGMDGEILWNLYNNGITLKFFEESYYHIKHGNAAPQVQSGVKQVDGNYTQGAHYSNKPTWGLTNYPRTKNNNVITIKTQPTNPIIQLSHK